MSRSKVLGIPFDDLTTDEAADAALALIDKREGRYAVTPNPEILLHARRDPKLRDALAGASLILADGVGVILASRLLGRPIKHRSPGIDVAAVLLEKLARRQGKVYLFGARPGVAEEAGRRMKRRWPGLLIAGCHDGYCSAEEEQRLLEDIRRSRPELLLVCLGSPRQELWMHEHAGQTNAGLMIGLGGTLDVFAGNVSRAPSIWRRHGLEWLYRMLQQPRRVGRVLRLIVFFPLVLIEKYRRKEND